MFISLGEPVCDRSHGFFPEIWTSSGRMGAAIVYLVTALTCASVGSWIHLPPASFLKQIGCHFVLLGGKEGSFGIVFDHFHISCQIFISYVQLIPNFLAAFLLHDLVGLIQKSSQRRELGIMQGVGKKKVKSVFKFWK